MIATIDDIAILLRNGKSVKQSEDLGGLPITRIETIADWKVDSSRVGFAGLSRRDNEDWLLRRGDLLISHINSTKHLGKCAIYDGVPPELIHGMNLLILRVDSKIADPEYVYRIIASPGFRRQIPRITKDSVNQSSFNISSFRKLQIPLPPLAEQKRIAGILDAADTLRAKRRESIDQLDALLQSTFLDMFGDPVTNPKGWKRSKLGDVALEKPAYGSGAPSRSYENGMPRYVRITDIDETGDLHEEKRSAALTDSEIEKYTLEDGDILFARSGATVGKTYLHSARNGFCVYAGYLIKFRTNRNVLLPEVLFRYTRTKAYKRWIESQARVVAQPNINAKMYSSLPVFLPPIDMQRHFVDVVESIYKHKDLLLNYHNHLDALCASLQDRAFKGEL